MHAAIDLALCERGLELVGEQALGADLAQRLVHAFVTGRLECHELRLHAVRGEHRSHLSRLPQGELGRAGGDAQQPWLCDRGYSHCCSIYSRQLAAGDDHNGTWWSWLATIFAPGRSLRARTRTPSDRFRLTELRSFSLFDASDSRSSQCLRRSAAPRLRAG